MNQPHNNSIQGPPKAGEPGTTKPLKTQGRRRETLQEKSDGEHLFTYNKTHSTSVFQEEELIDMLSLGRTADSRTGGVVIVQSDRRFHIGVDHAEQPHDLWTQGVTYLDDFQGMRCVTVNWTCRRKTAPNATVHSV